MQQTIIREERKSLRKYKVLCMSSGPTCQADTELPQVALDALKQVLSAAMVLLEKTMSDVLCSLPF